jgi:hypothetical protein
VAPATPTNVGYSHSNGKRPPTPDTNRIVPKLSSDLLNSPVGVAEDPSCGKSRSPIGEARVRFDVMLGARAIHSDETETKPSDSGDDGFRTATDGDENQPDTQFRATNPTGSEEVGFRTGTESDVDRQPATQFCGTNPTGSADDGLGKDPQSVGPAAGPVDLAPVTQQKAKALPSDGERMPEDVAVGAGIHAEAGMVDPSPGSPEAADPPTR